ncbi:MAG TPA: polysaccharide pyruvyl transferase family protein, partial [Verrucomicrobiae bacterium]|nr:polysaccharide pyruvyl transferase family protein [Verrucomicrobiae bacterium]
VEALLNADLVVASGCGLITDAFKINAGRWLDMLGVAIRCGIPTAMLGQGLGPIQDQELLERFVRTVPCVDAILIRENGAGLDLLKQARVPETKIFVTGDDAVELAYGEKRAVGGNQIGINLRIARYAELDEKIPEHFRNLLVEKARQYQCVLTGIPILRDGGASDLQTLQLLLDAKNTGEELDTPLKVIRRVSDCRVVVTGSYHAGVFALAQGIPVVAIIQSAYYRDKFQGLAEQFGCGCIVLQADDAEFLKKLGTAIDELWAQAGELKPKLLAAAERQIQSAQSAYAKLPALLRS